MPGHLGNLLEFGLFFMEEVEEVGFVVVERDGGVGVGRGPFLSRLFRFLFLFWLEFLLLNFDYLLHFLLMIQCGLGVASLFCQCSFSFYFAEFLRFLLAEFVGGTENAIGVELAHVGGEVDSESQLI